MKIMILANHDVGLYQFRKELIEELLKDNEVVISLPDGEMIDLLTRMGCKYIYTEIDRRGINPFRDIKLVFDYKKIIMSERPDLIITYTIKPNIYGGYVCSKLKIPYAINITGLGTAFEKGGLLKKLVTFLYKISCKKAKVVFFENEANRNLFVEERIVDKEKTYRLNGAGVNLKKYSLLDYPRDNRIKFLFMGRVMAEKGITELFEAMKRLIGEGVNCELNVIGGYEENFKAVIEKYESEGWLHYFGYQKDVRPFIEACHCMVLPSWHEGMANTNLEGAASGRPIITTNIPGCKEAVIDNRTGFLVKKRDVNDLYIKLKCFTEMSYEKRKNMGIEGRKHMEKVFDKTKVVRETINELMRNIQHGRDN